MDLPLIGLVVAGLLVLYAGFKITTFVLKIFFYLLAAGALAWAAWWFFSGAH